MNIRETFSALRAWIAGIWPSSAFWLGSAIALRYAAWIMLVVGTVWFILDPVTLYRTLGVALGVLLVAAFYWGARLAFALLIDMPAPLRDGLALFISTGMVILVGNTVTQWLSIGAIGIGTLLIGGGLAVSKDRGWRWQAAAPIALGSMVLVVWLIAFLLTGFPTSEKIVWQPIQSAKLQLDNPGLPGSHTFTLQTYGSGTDPHRQEFASQTTYTTQPVDGSKLIDGWEGRAAWGRSKYWGITDETLPIQGRAWVPDGKGPFPIALIVHGNHSMEDYSDKGYAYLGELFASRGVIAVSVDQNFLNGSFANVLGIPDVGLEEENDARGWLLLKHLEQWREWSDNPNHALYKKADLKRVVLIGHSRGGEAVSEAAVFNYLPAYPDDATLRFDFNFGLKGIIAIAPVDTQYDPRNAPTQPRDINYLVIHGSHDGDVTSYAGFATYNRVEFETCHTCFKAGIYLIGANHGQFNTSWGRRDSQMPSGSSLNLHHIMDANKQRDVARTLFSAFLETVFFGNDNYKAFIAAPDRAADLLPVDSRMLTQFSTATDTVLVDFSEDADVETGTLVGVQIHSEGLALWREQEIKLKWRNADTASAVIGWDSRSTESDDSTKSIPQYVVHLPSISVESGATLNLTLAPSNTKPGKAKDYEAPELTDFSLVLTDNAGQQASISLSKRRPLLKRAEPHVFKLHALQSDRSEVVFQRYRFELVEWSNENPALNLNDLDTLTLRFDKTDASSIILDEIAISQTGL